MNYSNNFINYWYSNSEPVEKKKKKVKKHKGQYIPIAEYKDKHVDVDYIPGVNNLFIIPRKETSENDPKSRLEDKITGLEKELQTIKANEESWA